jgi:hypothetical protein
MGGDENQESELVDEELSESTDALLFAVSYTSSSDLVSWLLLFDSGPS